MYIIFKLIDGGFRPLLILRQKGLEKTFGVSNSLLPLKLSLAEPGNCPFQVRAMMSPFTPIYQLTKLAQVNPISNAIGPNMKFS